MKTFRSRMATFLFWLGILSPLFTLGFELITHACAGQHFDPLPTWPHVALVALVPLSLISVWLAGRSEDPRRLKIAGFLHGLALVPILYYLLALGWLTPMACFVLPLTLPMALGREAGMTLLVLATLGPLLAFFGWWVAAVRLRRWRRERIVAPARGLRWPWRSGLLAGVLALGATELRMVLVYEDLHAATSVVHGHPKFVSSIERLRTPTREAFLLRLCYMGGATGAFGPLAYLFDRGVLGELAVKIGRPDLRAIPLELEDLRQIYFRVTGHVFSDVPPPRSRGAQTRRGMLWGNGTLFDNFAWDEERGGSNVGARVRGLSLATSRMDWQIEKNSALAYGEWTLEFRNENSNAQEARCQMLLPPRGCVSRLTLWIEGEPREAAFGSKQQVTQAYQQTVVVDRRDPVLVNMVGPDRVLTQCFPVPPGGTMKIRLGITAPVDDQVAGCLALPLIIERNFSIPVAIKHSIQVQGDGEFAISSDKKPTTKDGRWSWQGEAGYDDFQALRFVPKEPGAARVWTEDPFATAEEGKKLLREKTTNTPPSKSGRVVVVIDGSVQLQPHADEIRGALKALSSTHSLSVLLSTDAEPLKLDVSTLESALTEQHFRGGRDSLPALRRALTEARGSDPSQQPTVLWLHGPQPFAFRDTEEAERGTAFPTLHALCLSQGRNRILEQLYNQAEVRAESRWDGTQNNLLRLMQRACAGPDTPYVYRRTADMPADAIKVSDQLARMAVFEEVLTAFKGQDLVPDVQARRAARYQLVTPYSGAVVLETQEQYDRAGLKPVDGGAAPQILNGGAPEPHRTLLLLLGVAACVLRRRR